MLEKEGSASEGQWAAQACTLLLTRTELALLEGTLLPQQFSAFAHPNVLNNASNNGEAKRYYTTNARTIASACISLLHLFNITLQEHAFIRHQNKTKVFHSTVPAAALCVGLVCMR